jgi:hypothetical protein
MKSEETISAKLIPAPIKQICLNCKFNGSGVCRRFPRKEPVADRDWCGEFRQVFH